MIMVGGAGAGAAARSGSVGWVAAQALLMYGGIHAGVLTGAVAIASFWKISSASAIPVADARPCLSFWESMVIPCAALVYSSSAFWLVTSLASWMINLLIALVADFNLEMELSMLLPGAVAMRSSRTSLMTCAGIHSACSCCCWRWSSAGSRLLLRVRIVARTVICSLTHPTMVRDYTVVFVVVSVTAQRCARWRKAVEAGCQGPWAREVAEGGGSR